MPWHAASHKESTTQSMSAFHQLEALSASIPLSSALHVRHGPQCGFSKHCVRLEGCCVTKVNPISCITAPGAECNNKLWAGSTQVRMQCGALLVLWGEE